MDKGRSPRFMRERYSRHWHFFSPLLRAWIRIEPLGGYNATEWIKILRKFDFWVKKI